MDTNTRRENILNDLEISEIAIKGSKLAQKYKVSRQVIVQDIAILRARGIEIYATPQGYQIEKPRENVIRGRIVSKHETLEELEDELTTIIDLGGGILDVIVEHPIYGEIKAPLMLFSRRDIAEFIKKITNLEAEPLSKLTEGVHIHTIEARSEEILEEIKEALYDKEYLLKL
jgi:transcriptional regulator of NAD metabolism